MSQQLMLPRLQLPAYHPPAALTPTDALRDYPDVPSGHICEHAKILGTAGEFFCDALLLRHGIQSYQVPEFSAFDRFIYIDGQPLRLQTKVRHTAARGRYDFSVKRGDPRHPRGSRSYDAGDFDILAMVLLNEFVVKFSATWQSETSICFPEIPSLRAKPLESFERALRQLGVSDHLPQTPGNDVSAY